MASLLSTKTLPGLTFATKPNYERNNITTGIVHLGVGGFHRAHQAVYTDDLLATGDTRWGISGVSLRSNSAHNTLAPQDFLYTVKTKGQNDSRARVIGSLREVLVLPAEGGLRQVVEKIAAPTTQVVSLTITEKGYCHTPSGVLDEQHPDIIQDKMHPNNPQTAPGLLALAIAQRMTANAGPLTLLSCDNLASNGLVTRNVVEAMVLEQHPKAAQWLADNLSFPSSMVDRIVPKTDQQDLIDFENQAGYRDPGLVVCEPFTQWVIENDFAGDRPAWDLSGAQFVDHIQPFEQAKLQLLNATHSALAYLGTLTGYDYIHQAMADPRLAAFARRLMDEEITPIVAQPPGVDINQYKADILTRFANPEVPYRTAQVASDGSQKLPQRVFATIRAQQRLGNQTPSLHLVVAAWLQCLAAHRINDPRAKPVADIMATQSQPSDLVSAIATQTTQFGELGNSKAFLDGVTQALGNLREFNNLGALDKLANR